MICSNGHEVRTFIQGGCSECWQDRQKKYKHRRRLGMELLRAVEDRGLSGTQAIELFQALDGATIREVKAR